MELPSLRGTAAETGSDIATLTFSQGVCPPPIMAQNATISTTTAILQVLNSPQGILLHRRHVNIQIYLTNARKLFSI